ncbi:MAG: hypothetical protein FWE99_07525 [Bacteroidales bacterium]|nr:hypothetical protein [Bacteroidales bacterium]
MRTRILLVCTLCILFVSGACHYGRQTKAGEPQPIPIIKTALYDSASVFFGDFGNYPANSSLSPIGIFDSGTGGLTVMDAIVTLDMFNNSTGEEGPDGIRDFEGSSFVYLADQANMPYGNYASEGKTDYLRELVVQDALFLMGHKVKSMVIACNTATAVGLEDINSLLTLSQTGVSVTGVINAGAKGALERFGKEESGAIGVMATVGTIQTEGYERTIKEMAAALGYTGILQIINQPAMGFAEAVDEEPDFVLRSARQPRSNYRGPALGHPDYPIDVALLEAYNFDVDNNGILYSGTFGAYTQLQLNAAQNYARYHLLSLIEKLRKQPQPQALKALIMGCTHYPYYKETLGIMLEELLNYSRDGVYPYRNLIAEDVALVDPAVNTAKELYVLLRDQQLLAPNSSPTRAAFYITIPNVDLPEVDLETPNRFTYNYKYGRNPGTSLEYVKTVPFAPDNIDMETQHRLRRAIPATFSLIPHLP